MRMVIGIIATSIMENFFGILKQEIYYGHTFSSYEELKQTIEDYIEYYNNERIKKKLDFMSPVKYRIKYAEHRRIKKYPEHVKTCPG